MYVLYILLLLYIDLFVFIYYLFLHLLINSYYSLDTRMGGMARRYILYLHRSNIAFHKFESRENQLM